MRRLSVSRIGPRPAPGWGSLVAADSEMHVLEVERLLVQDRRAILAAVLPGGHVGKVLVVAQRFAILGLALHPEVAAARLGTVPGVQADQLGQLQEIGDPAGPFERLVQLLVLAENPDVAPELLADLRDTGQRLAQAGITAGHPAVVPHHVAQLAMEEVDRLRSVDREQRLDPLPYLRLGLAELRPVRLHPIWLDAGEEVRDRRREDEVAVRSEEHQRA